MMANFKKFGVAAAVASALGAAGAAQATTLGAPADALLVPFVIASTAKSGAVTNTLIGVTVADPSKANPGQFLDQSDTVNGGNGAIGVGTLSALTTKYSSGVFPTGTPYCNSSGRLHWYFFDIDSNEVADGTIPVTCEDFVRIDWNLVVNASFPSAKDLPGYFVIADDRNGSDRASGLILYGAAYQIQGDWRTEAFIPVVPLVDRRDGDAGDEVTRSGSFVSNVNPVTAGVLLPSPGTGATAAPGLVPNNNTSRFSLRYVADTANATFPTATTMVLWFPDLGYGDKIRQKTNILVYNTDEGNISAAVNIPHELNLVQVDPAADPDKPRAPHTTALRDGVSHTEADSGSPAVGGAVNTGFVLFDVKDYYGSATVVVDGNSLTQANVTTPIEGSRAGFAFSLISVASSNNVQTELAHERGLVNRP